MRKKIDVSLAPIVATTRTWQVGESLEREKMDVSLGSRIVKKAYGSGPLSHDADWFADDDNFAMGIQQVLFLMRQVLLFLI